MPQEQRPRSTLDAARNGFNLALDFMDAFNLSIVVFTRAGFGLWGLGKHGFWSMVLIFLYAMMLQSSAMLVYLALWLVMAMVHKLFPDPVQHSGYRGKPWMFEGITDNEYLARFMEAVSMLPIGNVLYGIAPEIGRWFHFAFLTLTAKAVIEYTLHRRRVIASGDWDAEAEAWQQAMLEAQRRLRR